MESEPLRFIVDNALSPALARELGANGYDALHVHDWGMAAASDREILDRAQRDDRVVITLDADFSDMLAADGRTAASIIRFRTSRNHTLTFCPCCSRIFQ